MGVTAALVALSVAGPARSQDEGETEAAKQHFMQGVALFGDGNYEAALVEFKASYKANVNFKVLYNIGLTLQALHHYVEAEEALGEYLVQGADKVPEDRLVEVTQIIAELRGVIGFLDVSCEVDGAAVLVDGVKKARTPVSEPIKLDVGTYHVEVVKDGYGTYETDVDIPGKETVSVDAVLHPRGLLGAKGHGKPLHPAVLFTTAGTAVALALAATITGGLAASKHEQFLDTPREDVSRWELLQDQGRDLALATDLMFGIAGAAAVAAIVMIFFTDFTRLERGPRTALVLPGVSGGAIGISLIGVFGGVSP